MSKVPDPVLSEVKGFVQGLINGKVANKWQNQEFNQGFWLHAPCSFLDIIFNYPDLIFLYDFALEWKYWKRNKIVSSMRAGIFFWFVHCSVTIPLESA